MQSTPNPLAALLAEAIAIAARDPAVVAAVRALVAPAAEPEPTRANRPQLAAILGVSVTTIQRFDGEGMPSTKIGKRLVYDVAACRAWLRERPAGPPKRAPKREAPVDLSGVRGLRAVGGGR